ncbi:MAG TPA: carboxypeptidase-like regulatory domain-containing protein, partial [Flavisolibacter sp.]|nr:carboxypeptidase-like regulatory domain-containing protein [Flavisolibacter sp.]
MKKVTSLTAMLLLTCALAFGQARTVTGVVRDGQGNPVPYATVAEAGTGNTVRADDKGEFTISVGANSRLTFTAVGFQSQTVGADAAATVVLTAAEAQMAEVVVTTAQGIRREKRGLGYSAPVVRNEELTKGQSTSALNALQGKVSGVNITST